MSTTTGNSGRATTLVDGTKLQTTLNGATAASIEIVVDINAVNTSSSRLVHIGGGSDSGYLTLSTPNLTTLYFYTLGGTLRGQWNPGFGAGRAVYHLVYDSGLATAGDRVRLYKDGTLVTKTGGTDPPLNEALSVPNGKYFALGNRELCCRSSDGSFYYAAIYDGALTASEVTTNSTALLALDDSAPNTAPTVAAAIPDTTVTMDDPPVLNYRDLNAVFTDAEEGSQLTFTIQSNTNPGLVTPTIGADSALDMSFTASTSGTATITVRATDGGSLFVDDVFTVTVDDPCAVTTLPFTDDFNRGTTATVGNCWVEEAEGGTADATINTNRLQLSSNNDTNSPRISHTFTQVSTGFLKWTYVFNWDRTGAEGTYELWMQLGNSATMVDPATSDNTGVAVNLKWASITRGMTNEEGFGYVQGAAVTQVAVVSGGPANDHTIEVIADLDLNTFKLKIDGITQASGVAFDNNVNIDAVRIYTDELDDGNFGNREFDDMTIEVVDYTLGFSSGGQKLHVGQPPVPMSLTTITDATAEGTFTDANDLRIRIPATFNMIWDTLGVSATIGGGASAKVSPTVSYEDAGKTLVLNVLTDFLASEQFTVADLSFMSFTAVSAADKLELEIYNDNVVTAEDTSNKEIVVGPSISSRTNQTFMVSDPATAADTITITESPTDPVINAAEDIRIRIPAGFNMIWDVGVTSVTIGGAAGNMNTTLLPYEDGNKTAVLNVTSDFAVSEAITVVGLTFTTFSAVSSADSLELEVEADGVVSAEDDKTIEIIPDGVAPDAIADLATGTVTSSSVQLSWTAPGDNGATGTATTYDVRYSTSTITAGNWASATQASGEPSPQVAGSGESFTVTGLSASTTYYFAIKTSDEVPNEAAISNVPSAATSATGVTYQEGDGKGIVSDTDDAEIRAGSATSNYGSLPSLNVDASAHVHTVIKFPGIFGGGANQIPLGSTIASATLTMEVNGSGDDMLVYQLIEGWVESQVTWNQGSTGVNWTNAGADGTGSHKATADGTMLGSTGSRSVDVTTSVQNWSFGELNEGWLLKDTGSNGTDMRSSEYGTASVRPMLTVTYVSNSAPAVAAAIPDTTVSEDSPPVDNYRDLNAVFTDANEGSQLTFTIQSNTNSGLVTPTIGADSALDLSFTASTTGSATITIRAADSGALFVDDVFTVTVTDQTDRPPIVVPPTVLVQRPPEAWGEGR